MKARYLWRAYKARYRDEAIELAAIKDAVRPGDVVCDIGANKGSYLYWLSRWVGPGMVVAFEPQESLAEYLRAVCKVTGLDNVTVEAKAVHAKSGALELHVPSAGNSPGASLSAKAGGQQDWRKTTVPVVSLDEYFKPKARISVLKIDVEGAEKGVFEGAARILTQQSPLLVFECENRHLEQATVADVFGHLRNLGYAGQFVSRKGLRPIEEFDPAIHQKQNGLRFWDAKDYCNNFVFRKNG